ncbi:MAG: FG-GAP repeat protein [bacterium]|nr:FG-GAP repeat protein [bacterium]
MRTGSLFHKLALACALTLPGGLASACLSFECQATDVTCRPESMLLYLLVDEPDCNFTESLNFDSLQQEAYIKTSNPDINDGLGGKLAFDCATQTLVLGLPAESSNATGVNGDQTDNSAASAGAAYVFRFQNDEWTQEAYLKASNTEGTDQFGTSVAISGDTLVVGASTEDSAATGVNGSQANGVMNSGAAYVFRRDSLDIWTQEAYLKASNTGNGDEFGRRVAISGDLIAVSARNEDSNAAGINGDQSDNSAGNAGAAYVFRRTGSGAAATWAQEAYIKASTPSGNERFGTSIALDGETLVVGAILDGSDATGIGPDPGNNLAPGSGAAFVFTAVDRVWSQQAYIKASNAEDCDTFGVDVALRGDLLAVSATEEASDATGINGDQSDNSAASAGAVYVFQRSGSTWTQEAYVKSSNTQGGDEFGSSLAVGNESLVVGAVVEDSGASGIDGNQADNSANGAGAAYLFRRNDGQWSQSAYIKASNTGMGDQFGTSIAMSGDGMAIIASDEDGPASGINGTQGDGTSASGAVYFFR